MSDSYTLTVHIALRGTPLLDLLNGTPTGKNSTPGHMWYNIQKGDGPEQSYGFQPKISVPIGPGKVVTTDNATYYKPRHPRRDRRAKIGGDAFWTVEGPDLLEGAFTG